MSIIYNKNLNPLLNFLINCISARSARQILSIKDENTFENISTGTQLDYK